MWDWLHGPHNTIGLGQKTKFSRISFIMRFFLLFISNVLDLPLYLFIVLEIMLSTLFTGAFSNIPSTCPNYLNWFSMFSSLIVAKNILLMHCNTSHLISIFFHFSSSMPKTLFFFYENIYYTFVFINKFVLSL